MADEGTRNAEDHEIGEKLEGEALRRFEESYEKNREALERLAEM